MELVRIGKIVNTHGIKGELRILSDFEFKDKVFKKGVKVYVGKKNLLSIHIDFIKFLIWLLLKDSII